MSWSQTPVRLAPGDTVAFSVLGAPQLERETTIDVDGTIFLPIAGKIKASGLTLNELRNDMYAALRDRTYRVLGAGGEDIWRRIQEDELFLDIREYRPVYVTGDVRNPGEVRFRPGLSVRQAMAVAGGVGRPVEEGSSDEILSLLTQRSMLLGRIETQTTNLDRYKADLDRVIATLAGANGANAGDAATPEGPGDPMSASDIDEIAQRWLAARSDLGALTETGNGLILDRMKRRLEVLEVLEDAGEKNLGFAQDQLDRVTHLAERGLTPVSTVSEAQSNLLQSSTRALETSGEVLRMRLDMTRFAEDAKADLTTEEIRLLDQILTGTASLDDMKRQLGALDTRLTLLGAVSTEDQEASLDVMLFRAGPEAEAAGTVAKPEMPLAPGDVLEVTLTLPNSEITTQ